MEWLLLWLALSAISLEGIAFFVNDESYHKEFVVATGAIIRNYDIPFGLTIGLSLYFIMLIFSPVVVYILLSMED